MSMTLQENAVLIIQIYPTEGLPGRGSFELQLEDRRSGNLGGIEVQSFATEGEARGAILRRIAST